MRYLFYFLGSILVITAFYILILAIKSKKPFKFIFLNAICGIFVLLIINFTKKYTGVGLPINQFTTIGCSVLGTPCALGFLILNLVLM